MGLLAEVLPRVLPIAVFLVAITVTAELAERAGVFDVAAHWLAHRGRHRLWLLWLLFSGLAVACTVVLSLDTTAVLLTPVGLALARQIGASRLPFALTTLWVANTGSLLLPVSNLTNLLALQPFSRMGVTHGDYVRLAVWPALAAVVATLAVILVLRRAELLRAYAVEPPAEPHDRTLLRVAGAVCVALGPLFAAGLSPALVASLACATLLGATARRAPVLLRGLGVPWLMAVAFVVLSVAVTWAHGQGLGTLLARAAGTGDGPLDLARVATTGAVGANLVNNLPAYLALEPSGDTPARLLALLVGVNAGPLVTPWASLATLLWLQRCRAAGVRLSPLRLALAGLLCSTLAVGAAVAALSSSA